MFRIIPIGALILLTACATPGTTNKANTFKAGQVNQRQEVKTVTILTLKPAIVEVNNRKNQEIAESVGALFGAALGATLGDRNDRALGGGIIGAAVGGEAGRLGQGATKQVNGVQIIYREGSRILSSAQVGTPCEYAPGPALVIVTQANETRIQSNHTCVEGQEMVIGRVSNLQGFDELDIVSDQQKLDDLERANALLRKQQKVQQAKTGLAKETARTDSARTKVDLELDTHRSVNQAIKNIGN